MRGHLLAAVLSLAACYQPVGSFSPYSHAVHTDQICSEAVEMGPGDVAIVKKAGGVMTGRLVINTNHGYVEREAAMNGGTHFIPVGVAYGGKTPRFDVYRVPRSGWESLPAGLVPKVE